MAVKLSGLLILSDHTSLAKIVAIGDNQSQTIKKMVIFFIDPDYVPGMPVDNNWF